MHVWFEASGLMIELMGVARLVYRVEEFSSRFVGPGEVLRLIGFGVSWLGGLGLHCL